MFTFYLSLLGDNNCISTESCETDGSKMDEIIGKITERLTFHIINYYIDCQDAVGTLEERGTIPGEEFTCSLYIRYFICLR